MKIEFELLRDVCGFNRRVFICKYDKDISKIRSCEESCCPLKTTEASPAVCQTCGGSLEYYFNRFWGWIFGSSLLCTKCGRKWTDKLGPQ